jgi:hypothetical protein
VLLSGTIGRESAERIRAKLVELADQFDLYQAQDSVLPAAQRE